MHKRGNVNYSKSSQIGFPLTNKCIFLRMRKSIHFSVTAAINLFFLAKPLSTFFPLQLQCWLRGEKRKDFHVGPNDLQLWTGKMQTHLTGAIMKRSNKVWSILPFFSPKQTLFHSWKWRRALSFIPSLQLRKVKKWANTYYPHGIIKPFLFRASPNLSQEKLQQRKKTVFFISMVEWDSGVRVRLMCLR